MTTFNETTRIERIALIARAMELREEGHPLYIVSEQRWGAALQA